MEWKWSHFAEEIILWGVRQYVARSVTVNRPHDTAIVIRQSKYLNSLMEQDHRAVKRVVRPMLGFKSFWAACCTIAGIEVMHALRKGQLATTESMSQTPAEQFYALAA